MTRLQVLCVLLLASVLVAEVAAKPAALSIKGKQGSLDELDDRAVEWPSMKRFLGRQTAEVRSHQTF